MKPVPQDYREAVQTALRQDGRSVYLLAKDAGVHQPTLCDWLNGKNQSINSVSLSRICRELGLKLMPFGRRG